ncbi:MAG: DUF5916 domain-containing protein [Aurantibacter sp.]
MTRELFSTLILISLSVAVWSQQSESLRSLHVSRTDGQIHLDGQLDEPAWQQAGWTSDFSQYFPSDTSLAEGQSEILMTYDDENLYVAVICHSLGERQYMTPSLRRDYRGGGTDGINLLFDTFNDNTNAFMFGLNPYGVQREGLISNGGSGREDFNLSWDNKWKAESKVYGTYWIGEIAIPFKTLRFNEGVDRWKFNSYRLDTEFNERSTWSHIPRNFIVFSLAFSGELIFEEPLKKPGANVSIIPYSTASVSKDHERGKSTDYSGAIGGDAKVALTPGLNLDLTVNPDFSQVEVDRQVTNLTRFEINFPERRQFFLENGDLFASLGEQNSRPFFSRRIGITRDTLLNQNVENKIHYGVRLSGKIDQNWRVGVMNMQTAKETSLGLPSANHTVTAVQRRVFKRSNITALFVNRQVTGDESNGQYNRVLGLEYNLASLDNSWTGKAYYHRSMDWESQNDEFAHGLQLEHSKRRYQLRWSHQMIGEGFAAEDGFVPRTGFNKISPEGELSFYPASGSINEHGPEIEYEYIWDKNGKTDELLKLGYKFTFQNRSRVELSVNQEYTYLFDDFDPTGDGVVLPEGTDYRYSYFLMEFNSDDRKLFNYEIMARAGGYFNGNLYGVGGEINYRIQPYGGLSMNFDYNRLLFPEPYQDADVILIGPRVELTFTRKLFFSVLAQYNNQIDNLNINARFQWRFKPVSDLFVVYTDNYFPESLKVKNRALVLKLTYWLNL